MCYMILYQNVPFDECYDIPRQLTEHQYETSQEKCNDPVSVLGFVPGIVDGLFMIDCGPGFMDMLFVY